MLVSLHEHFPVRVLDWLLSAMLFSWGIALFEVDPRIWSLPTFSGLSNLAPQYTWAAVATVIGLARVIALFINGAIRRSPHLRLIGAGLSVFIWVQLSLGIMFSQYVGPGIALFPWLAFADIFNVHRAAKDARVSDHRASKLRDVAAARVPAGT